MDKDDYDDVANGSGTDDFEIHFVNRLFGGTVAGVARLPSKNIFGQEDEDNYCIAIASTNPTTLAHEIGHALGLAHTHDGGRSGNDSNYDCGDCYQESVSRTRKQGLVCFSTIGEKKCDVNGDFFCDTPADPNLFYGNVDRVEGCVYNGELGSDRWGAIWTPQEGNIMSYARGGCRSVFTPQQAIWMLLNLPSFATSSPGYQITGPAQLCPYESATYSVPSISGVSDYHWDVPSGWAISGQGSRSVIITASNSRTGTISVTPDCGRPEIHKSIINKMMTIAVNGPYTICEGDYGNFSTTSQGSSYTWTVTGNLVIYGQGNSHVQVYAPNGTGSGGGYVSVNVIFDDCSGYAGRGFGILSSDNCYVNTMTGADTTENAIGISSKEKVSNVTTKELQSLSLDKVSDILIYPNPASQQVNILLKEPAEIQVRLINSLGQSIWEKKSREMKTTLDLLSLPKGAYLLEVISPKSRYMKRLIIQ